MPASAITPKWIRRCQQTSGHGIGVALDVYTKSSMEDRATAAKQLEDSVLTKAVRSRKRSRDS
jgi:hypothetical protein